jgi:excisionase family DNA binding protein
MGENTQGQTSLQETVAPAARLALSVEETAARLGVGRAAAYEAIKRGEIPILKIGRRILVPLAALEKLLAGAAS